MEPRVRVAVRLLPGAAIMPEIARFNGAASESRGETLLVTACLLVLLVASMEPRVRVAVRLPLYGSRNRENHKRFNGAASESRGETSRAVINLLQPAALQWSRE